MTEKRVPMRRCIGCMQSHPQEDLIRLTWDGTQIAADHGRPADGRGIYLCRNEECIGRVRRKRALNRVLRKNLDEAMTNSVLDALLDELKEVTNGKKDQ